MRMNRIIVAMLIALAAFALPACERGIDQQISTKKQKLTHTIKIGDVDHTAIIWSAQRPGGMFPVGVVVFACDTPAKQQPKVECYNGVGGWWLIINGQKHEAPLGTLYYIEAGQITQTHRGAIQPVHTTNVDRFTEHLAKLIGG